jgi:hypothetical protein
MNPRVTAVEVIDFHRLLVTFRNLDSTNKCNSFLTGKKVVS